MSYFAVKYIVHRKMTLAPWVDHCNVWNVQGLYCIFKVCTLADSGFFKNFLYQGSVKSTVSCVFEDLKFKISDDYDQNWCFSDSAHLAVSV